eukprot:1341820-Rhodomonas_salina.2
MQTKERDPGRGFNSDSWRRVTPPGPRIGAAGKNRSCGLTSSRFCYINRGPDSLSEHRLSANRATCPDARTPLHPLPLSSPPSRPLSRPPSASPPRPPSFQQPSSRWSFTPIDASSFLDNAVLLA